MPARETPEDHSSAKKKANQSSMVWFHGDTDVPPKTNLASGEPSLTQLTGSLILCLLKNQVDLMLRFYPLL